MRLVARARRLGMAVVLAVSVLAFSVPSAFALSTGPAGQPLLDTLGQAIADDLPALGGELLPVVVGGGSDLGSIQAVAIRTCAGEIRSNGGFPNWFATDFTNISSSIWADTGPGCDFALAFPALFPNGAIVATEPWVGRFCASVQVYDGGGYWWPASISGSSGPGSYSWLTDSYMHGLATGTGMPSSYPQTAAAEISWLDEACPSSWLSTVYGTGYTGSIAGSSPSPPGGYYGVCNAEYPTNGSGSSNWYVQIACTSVTAPLGAVNYGFSWTITTSGSPFTQTCTPSTLAGTTISPFTWSGGAFTCASGPFAGTLGGGGFASTIVSYHWCSTGCTASYPAQVGTVTNGSAAPTIPGPVSAPASSPATTVAPATAPAPTSVPPTTVPVAPPATVSGGSSPTVTASSGATTVYNPGDNGIVSELFNGFKDVVNAVEWGAGRTVDAIGFLGGTLGNDLWTDIDWMVNQLTPFLDATVGAINGLDQDVIAGFESVVTSVTGLAGDIGSVATDVVNVGTGIGTVATDLTSGLASVATDVVALPGLILGGLLPILEEAFEPSATTLTSVETTASGVFPLSWVPALTGGGTALVTGVSGGLGGGECGPYIGWTAHGAVPAWGINMPSPSTSGCPGNGPGGSRTAQDDSAGDLFGYRVVVRDGVMAFMFLAFAVRVIRSGPWNADADDLAPNVVAD